MKATHTIEQLRAALASGNVHAFERVVRAGESHETDDEAFAALYGWKPGNGKVFSDFSDHPKLPFLSSWGWTSAAGAFQAMAATPDGRVKTDTWGDFVAWCAARGYRPLFGQDDQRLFFAWCLSRRGALDDVMAGRLEAAIAKCNREWASLPGSPYGQPVRTMAQAKATFARWSAAAGREIEPGASIAAAPVPTQPPKPLQAPAAPIPPASSWHNSAGEAADAPEVNMPVSILAGIGKSIFTSALPTIVSAIPKLGGIFGTGSEVATRNVKAVEVIAETIGAAVQAKNAQDLVEAMADPAKVEAARAAVQANWGTITEVVEGGGGGIAGARDFLLKGADNPAVWEIIRVVTYSALGFLLLANVIAMAAWGIAVWRDVGLESATQFLSQVITADIGSALTGIGFWLGSSWGSKRKEQQA